MSAPPTMKRVVGESLLLFQREYASARNGKCSPALVDATKWWLEVFENKLTQSVSLKHKLKHVDIFCDASSSPPVLAAVVFSKTCVRYCVEDCPVWVFQKLENRDDDQIMAYEIMAILMAIESFREEC